MREITTHRVDGAKTVRVYAIDEPDYETGGGACHSYFIQWDGPAPPEGAVLQAEMRDCEYSWNTADRRLHVRGCAVSFQHGPIKDVGVNGLTNEALLAIVLDRLDGFQAGRFACESNARARTNINQGLHGLLKRTRDRVKRKVEGLLKP